MKRLKKSLKDNGIIDNKIYQHLKPIDLPAPRFYAQPKLNLMFLYVQLFLKS